VLAREVYNRNNYAKGDGLPFGGSIPPCLDPEASPLPPANEEICSAFSPMIARTMSRSYLSGRS